MKLLSMFVESIRVANRLESLRPHEGVAHAERYTADFCGQMPEQTSQPGRTGDSELLDGLLVKPL